MDEEQRVVKLVPEVERRAGVEPESVERELRATLGRNEEAPLDSSLDERAHIFRSRDAAHVREHRNSIRETTEGGTVPLIRVELFDFRMNEETSEKLIAGLTDALCAATHEGLRDHTWVIVEGHNPKNWGLGGKPWPVEAMPKPNPPDST